MCTLLLLFGVATVIFVGLPVNHATLSPQVIIQWPKECEGKTYCTKRPNNYQENLFDELLKVKDGSKFLIERSGGMENRTGEDVASCRVKRYMAPVYLIKDDSDRIRQVTQTANFKVNVQIEECRKPGRLLRSDLLDVMLLAKNRVDCVETKVPMEFPVLSLDGTKLESVGPMGGIPSSCSAKLIKKD